MARADMASASARSDSIKGLAQSIANPAYRRLLTAEPALRRAVPALIIAFLLTIGVGAVVQVLDHRRLAIMEAINDVGNVADLVSERFATPKASSLRPRRSVDLRGRGSPTCSAIPSR
jgi:two-component system cell cycle sensor histidine kinase PleC